jgi:murein DD-endopeptidase MepM/ murein hydrolase activator NlpD
MINKSSRAGSGPRFVALRARAASLAQPSLRAIGILGVCMLGLALWFVPVGEKPVDSVVAAATVTPPEDGAWRGFLAQLPAPEEVQAFTLAPALPAPGPAPFEKAVLRLAKRDTLAGLLADLDLDRREIANAVAALRPHLDIRRLRIGQAVHVTLHRPEQADVPVLQDLTIRPEPQRQIMLERRELGGFRATEKMFEVLKRVRHAAGLIQGSLIASAQQVGLPPGALQEMLRAFAWDVSFQHDLRAGDRFAALFEQLHTEDGRLVGTGRLLWAELTTGNGGKNLSIYRFKPKSGREFFYTARGESVVRALLRTPLDLARLTVSSTFGFRRHPLLGFTRLHAGVDFAAPPGTPVLAAGDGRVVQAGRNGGYGNWVKIVHSGALSTAYAHLRRIAPGIRSGTRVRQSQVIGFVGSTGLSTGPHLHFELQRSGKPVDPLSVAHRSLRARLAGADLTRFRQVVAEIDRLRAAADSL